MRRYAEPQPWKAHGACQGVDPDLFYPERGDTATVRAAKAICAVCPVQAECLNQALTRPERLGIWGGTSERARRDLRRRLGISRRRQPRKEAA